jgi:tetratricopeptide (TPR) repeat protein
MLRDVARDGRPEGILALVEYLSRHKRIAEALALCAAAWKTCPAEYVAASSLAAVRTGGASAAELAALAEQFAVASDKRPESVALLQARAELEELRERFDSALVLYEKILLRDRDYSPALNNRAWLLALQAVSGDEALRLIEHVLSREGPLANYLDTRAVACLASGQTSRAIADMEEAIRQEPAAPYFFHLAQAHLLAGDRQAAATDLREGRKHGLRPDIVHPLERERCRQILAEPDLN